MKHFNLLVIGGDAAGMSAASQARRTDNDISIGVLERGEHVSYAACGMPYYISDVIKDDKKLLAINPEEFIEKRNIQIMRGYEATAVDTSSKKVSVHGPEGDEEMSYDTLVIATGATAFVPPFPGADTDGVYYLRNLNDGLAIRKFLDEQKPSSGIIIGGGYIGLEMAETLRERDIDCRLIERMENVAMHMSPEIREIVKETLEKHDVALNLATEVTAIENNGKSVTVKTSNGDFTADFVLISVGVTPATSFLEGTDIALSRNGAIIVDEESRTNVQDVYAGGDCCTVKHRITGKDTYMPLGSTANKQGRVAGLQAAGIATERFDGIVGSQFVKVFELEVGKTGFNAHDAEVEGIDATTVTSRWNSHAHYYPNAKKLFVTLTINNATRQVIGGEVAGEAGAVLRTNVFATAITAGMKVEELAYLDLGYAPPFAPVWDAIHSAAQKLVVRKK